MDNKLIGISIAVVVSVILVGSLLIPVIQDADEGQQYTYVNKGYRASAVTADVSYSWDATNGITLSDSTKIAPSSANGPLIVLACDHGYIKTNFAGTTASFYLFGDSVSAANNITAMDVSVDFDTKTVSISNVTASTTIADASFTYSEWCYVPSVNGENVIYAPYSTANTFYIEDDSPIKGFFHDGGTWAVSLNNETGVANYGSPTFTAGIKKTSTEYNGLSTMSIIQPGDSDYAITVSDTAYTPDFIVLEREATGTTDVGESISPILAVIPLMIIVAILAFVVRAAIRRN